MKKRLAKKIEKMRRKKIHEALEMVLEINTTHVRETVERMACPSWIFAHGKF